VTLAVSPKNKKLAEVAGLTEDSEAGMKSSRIFATGSRFCGSRSLTNGRHGSRSIIMQV
jgi:hypothetical protein